MSKDQEEIIEELIGVLACPAFARSYTPKSKVIDEFSVQILLRELRKLGQPPITIEQITFVEV